MAIVLVVAGTLGYEFGYKASRQRAQSWSGQIVERHRSRNWLRGFKEPLDRAEYRYYTHYWTVERRIDGAVFDVETPYGLWRRGNVGDPVEKIQGERWPTIDTEEERSRQQAVDQLFGEFYEGVRGGTSGGD